MSKKLKIAIYSGQIPSTTFIESLIKAVAKYHEVFLFGFQSGPINYTNKNIKIFKIPNGNLSKLAYNVWRSLKLGLSRPKDLAALVKIVLTYKTAYTKWQNYSKLLPMVLQRPDILHIQWAKSLEDLMVLKTAFNIPIVLSLRGSHINYSPLVSTKLASSYRENFPQVDAFHAVSKAIALQAENYGSNPKNIHVIYSIIPKLFFDAYQPLNTKPKKIIKIISVGRSHWIKGYTYAIHTMAILKKQGFLVEYQIIGIDKPHEELLFLISEFGLDQNIKLKPKIPQKELLALLLTQDVLLLSSLEEGIANVVLEAMAIGLPVISTECGGMGEVVINGKTGFLIPTRDSEAMAKAIIDLDNMPYLQLQNQTQNAHKMIREKFSEENNVERFFKLYAHAKELNF